MRDRGRFQVAGAAGLLGALALAWPFGAGGFSAQGHRWPNASGQPVSFVMAPAGTDDVADDSDLDAVRRAFQTWQSVACSYLSFVEQPWSDPATVENDGVHRVFWVEDRADWPAGQQSTLALTYTFYSLDGDREITDADMILNGVDWRWTTDETQVGSGTPARVDVETVVFHEVGHFFGLDHSRDPSAAMYPSNNKLTQRGPASDDVHGICALYPNGEPVPGTPANAAPVGAPCVTGGDCASGLCIDDLQLQRKYCSTECVVTQEDACPVGFACEQAGNGRAYCFAPTPVDELCDQCTNGEHCASGLCVTVPNINNLQPFCSRACDPTPGQPQSCPQGYQCVLSRQAATLVGTCVPSTGICDPRGKGGHNELCYANGRCKAGHRCIEYFPGTGLAFCFAECPASAVGQSCGVDRVVCDRVQGQMNTAACFTIARVGEPCIPEVCDASTSFCAWDEAAGIDSALCYRLCTAGQSDCPANNQCQVFEGLPPLCVPNEGFKRIGDQCAGDDECESRLCRPFLGDVFLCTEACEPSDPASCTPGLRCYTNPGATSGLCGPQRIDQTDDPGRAVDVPADYCACDRTNGCDDGCSCDPECGDSGCACVGPAGRRPAARTAGLVATLLAAALIIGLRAGRSRS